MKFNRQEMCWEGFEPPSSCYGGGSSQQSSGSGVQAGQSLSLPSNMQNPAFQGNAGITAGQLGFLGGGGFADSGGIYGGLTPSTVYGQTSAGPTNPLVAPVTGAQNQTLSQIGQLLGQTPNTLSGAFGLLNSEMGPNFASGLATSPQTMAAEQAAIQPMQQQFNAQTVPGLQGSFTQAGQRVGSSSGMGSSAFDNAFANAQGNEMATESAVTGQIANNAYQTGLNMQANAPGQMASLTNSELNQMISGLNAQALPQLTQQYGISAGTQLYQQQMNTILQALGLQVQGEQPAIGYSTEGSNFGVQQNQSSGSSFGIANPFAAIPS